MAQNKKYEYRLIQQGDSWRAEISRRVTSKRSLISKQQDGFASEAEASAWAEAELKEFLLRLKERNKRDSKPG